MKLRYSYTPDQENPGRAYVGGPVIAFEGLDAPLPCIGHVGPRDGPHPLRNLLLAQHVPADSGGVERTTHVAYLVGSGLQRANPAADKGSEQVVRGQPLLRHVLLQHRMRGVDVNDQLLGVETPVVLLGGGSQAEGRQVDKLGGRGALHVEKVRCHFRQDSSPRTLGKIEFFRGEMDAAPVAVIRFVSTPAAGTLCFFS